MCRIDSEVIQDSHTRESSDRTIVCSDVNNYRSKQQGDAIDVPR